MKVEGNHIAEDTSLVGDPEASLFTASNKSANWNPSIAEYRFEMKVLKLEVDNLHKVLDPLVAIPETLSTMNPLSYNPVEG